jgi:hypothetical protein
MAETPMRLDLPEHFAVQEEAVEDMLRPDQTALPTAMAEMVAQEQAAASADHRSHMREAAVAHMDMKQDRPRTPVVLEETEVEVEVPETDLRQLPEP